MLLLIVPGVIYKIRTSLYAVIIICEGKEYREALAESKKLVKGHTWKVLWYFTAAILVLFIPPMALSALLINAVKTMDSRIMPAAVVLSSTLFSIATLLFQLTTVHIYKALKSS